MVSEEDLKNMSPEEIRELQEQNCIFCKIAKKEIPSKVIYEDDTVFAFLDIQPLSFGHVLLTTKKHHVFFSQVDDRQTGHLFKVAKQISQSMLKALQVTGTNIVIGNGEIAGQAAPHMLMHIVPRKDGETIDNFHPQKGQISEQDLLKVQKALIDRIDTVMKTDMKSKILEKKKNQKEENNEREDENTTKSESIDSKQDKTSQKENTQVTKKQNIDEDKQDEPENKKDTSEDNDDMDLDKISGLFK